MAVKPPKLRFHYNKVERQERSRLEAIMVDSTKTEADRDFARERLQAIRDGVVARAKIRLARRADYVEPAEKPDTPVAEDEPPARPTLDDCDGNDALLREETELWQIKLNDRAARKVLESPKHSLLLRQNAERTLRKGAERRRELRPTASDGAEADDATRVKSPEELRPLLHKPFTSRHAKGTPEYKEEEQNWRTMHRLEDEKERTRFREEHPEEWARHRKEWDDHLERCANDGGHDHLGNQLDRQGRVIGKRGGPSLPTHSDGSFIATLLQTETWAKQSKEFARRRGEIVDAPPAPPPPDRTTAYRLWDGFMFWIDNVPCESPLPTGTRVLGASLPPHYHENDNQIPPGLKFDPISFVWVQDPTAQTSARRI